MPEVRIWVDAAWPVYFFEESAEPSQSTRRDEKIWVSPKTYDRWVRLRAEYEDLQAHLEQQLRVD